ncbi:hypothetical protein HYE68_008811 [Fusarium pseudograminearum]|nr:hypothetical protein HYE68_008811 [Fusarium pseudograminearum]
MLLDVCLVVYNQSTARKRVPGHWSIFMGKSDLSKGTVFQAVGSGFHGYQPEIKRNYDLKNTFRKYTTFSLGQIDDSHLDHLEQVTRSLPGAGTAPNPLDPFSGENCQDWAKTFIQIVVDQGLLPSTAVDALANAPIE